MTTPSSNMLILTDLYRYNTWANARVFAACADLEATVLLEDARGSLGTIEETLKHLVGVEDVYLTLIQGLPLDPHGGRETYFAHDIAWFGDRATHLGDGYRDLLTSQGDALLDRDLVIPWFTFPLTARDGLLQVLSHSAQHRAQVLSILGARGVEVPNIDYVFMVGETRA